MNLYIKIYVLFQIICSSSKIVAYLLGFFLRLYLIRIKNKMYYSKNLIIQHYNEIYNKESNILF